MQASSRIRNLADHLRHLVILLGDIQRDQEPRDHVIRRGRGRDLDHLLLIEALALHRLENGITHADIPRHRIRVFQYSPLLLAQRALARRM